MIKLFPGMQVRVGGKLGCIMTVKSVRGDEAVLVDNNSTFYFKSGDCSLFPVKEVRYEQLTLF